MTLFKRLLAYPILAVGFLLLLLIFLVIVVFQFVQDRFFLPESCEESHGES